MLTMESVTLMMGNGGATLKKNGESASLKSGYMVSLEGSEIQVNANDKKAVLEALQKQSESVQGSIYVGLWVDGGIAYIDKSIRVATKKDALEMAKENKQLAIYNNKKSEAIYVGL